MAEDTKGASRQRSRNFPMIDLVKALERLRVLKEAGGGAYTPIEIAAKHWGYSAKSSVLLRTVGALNQYRLLDEDGGGQARRIKPSSLATRILDHYDDTVRQAAIQEAALSPAVYRELWDRFSGELPPDETLEWELRHGELVGFVGATSVKDFIRTFRATLEFTGPSASGNMAPKGKTEKDVDPELSMEGSGDPMAEASQNPMGQEPTGGAAQQTYFKVPVEMKGSLRGIIGIPTPLTPAQWSKFEEALETVKGLKSLLVRDEN